MIVGAGTTIILLYSPKTASLYIVTVDGTRLLPTIWPTTPLSYALPATVTTTLANLAPGLSSIECLYLGDGA